VENPSVQAGFVDMDMIPSLKLVSPTLVEEQELEKMDVRMEEKNPTTQQLGLGEPQ
jgi:hypothetical protein